MGFWSLLEVNIFEVILKGFLIGIIVSAPMGPVGVLCIQRTFNKGRFYGVVTGIGATTSDIIYALATGLGMSFMMDFIENTQNLFILQLAGSVLLFLFGIYMYQSKPRGLEGTHRSGKKGKGTFFHNYITSFLLTISNPLIILLFVALFARFAFVIPSHPLPQIIGYASIVLGAMSWWLVLTYFVNKMRNNFSTKRIKHMNMIIGVIVMIAALGGALVTLFRLHISI